MNKARLIFSILLVGLAVSVFLIKGHFAVQTILPLIFLLVFIPTIIEPDIGLVIIIFSMLFSPETIAGKTTGRPVIIRIEDVILMMVILGWLIRASLTKNIADTFRTALTAPFFLYLSVCIISTLLAMLFKGADMRDIDPGMSFFTILKYCEYFLLFIMVRDNIKSLRQVKALVAVFFSVALVVAIFSNAFIDKALESGREFFRVAPPVTIRGAGEAGTLAGYLIFMMAVGGGIILYIRSMPVKIFLICLEALMFRALMYTLSRGAYIAFIPMVAALALTSKKGRIAFVWAAIALALLGPIFLPNMIRERIATTVALQEELEGARIIWQGSPMARIESWKSILFDIFPKSPVFGVGVARGFVDGQFFLALYETGLAGLILLSWVLARLFSMARDVLSLDSVRGNNFAMGLTVGFIAGFVGLLIQALSTNTFIIIKIMEPFWFIAAIVVKLPDLVKAEETITKQ